jgi:hypothetical protein
MNPAPSRIAIALGCMVLALLFTLNAPAIADAETRGRDRVPSQLWRTYPLDPGKEQARIRGGTEADGQRGEPYPVQTTPIGAKARDAQAQPSRVDDGSTDMRKLAMLGLSLLALLGLVILLVARYPAVLARNAPGRLMHVRAAVISPSWSGAGAPHRRLAPSSLVPKMHRQSAALRWARRLPMQLISTLVGVSKQFGLRATSYAAAAMRAPVRAGAGTAHGLRFVALTLFLYRREILFYAIVILVSAAVGIGISYFLSSGL